MKNNDLMIFGLGVAAVYLLSKRSAPPKSGGLLSSDPYTSTRPVIQPPTYTDNTGINENGALVIETQTILAPEKVPYSESYLDPGVLSEGQLQTAYNTQMSLADKFKANLADFLKVMQNMQASGQRVPTQWIDIYEARNQFGIVDERTGIPYSAQFVLNRLWEVW